MVAQRIAEGDLNVSFKNPDKATGVYKALYDMTERLRKVVGDVHLAALNTASGSQQINSASQHLSEGSTEQAASLGRNLFIDGADGSQYPSERG